MQQLEALLQKHRITSAKSIQQFAEKAEILCLSKNEHLLREGKKNNYEYLLLEGILHRYNVSDSGQEVTTGFYLNGSVITPHFARTVNGKNIFSMQALGACTLAAIHVHVLDELRNTNKEFYIFGQSVIEQELARTFYNEVVFRSFNAKERLIEMRKQYPNLENLVPYNIIASYLGITHVSFSRLRKEMAQQ